MWFRVIRALDFWVANLSSYVSIYSALPEARSMAALTIAGLLLLSGLWRLSLPALVAALCCVAAAKWLSQGPWIESQLQSASVAGKVVVVVGASRGIGLYTARRLASLGPRKLILGIRGDETRVQKICNSICPKARGGNVVGLPIDLTDLRSVVAFVESVKREADSVVDVLVCNAGCLAPHDWRAHRLTQDGLEPSWQSNVVGHFIVVEELLPCLLRAGDARVVHLSSIAHSWALRPIDYTALTRVSPSKWRHDPVELYAWAKLALIYHTHDLHERYGSRGLTAVSVHPGIVRTEIQDASVSRLTSWTYSLCSYLTGKSVAQGSQTVLFCCTHPSVKGGLWFSDCRPLTPTPLARDAVERKKCVHWLTEARRSATPRSLEMRKQETPVQ
eukprot:Gregarina_sp_Pseudo_9__375@NODE_1243_length_1746_cov_131_668424_g1169_i0_p1_GENE_NODE_1243_length_1746_cov_131_668424_g1169_i0NODE_1243_length_1746_cov_131_668424_g1169_i0_p1_ORF_typecomplete_len389_score95_35adh_short/PF00106_25/5_9e41adh_short_C2/PF13561_6/1_4e26KR/PF08659_10/3_1e10Epimerase/PF01370_21/3_4e08Sacchrp_dh_NADP/PF03435_18/0_0222Hacid_dh_C/PF02826_19/0_035MFS_MOT1/PF16983_5/0_3DUF4131/PF13567_6/7DUF4131/PF13567_6/3_7e03_NODE_1243_length_1746_cov_131_668424_g1169_i03861552